MGLESLISSGCSTREEDTVKLIIKVTNQFKALAEDAYQKRDAALALVDKCRQNTEEALSLVERLLQENAILRRELAAFGVKIER